MDHPDDTDVEWGEVARPVSGGADAEAMKQRIASRIFGAESGAVCIGRFEVLESIGAGGMGVVYRARDPKLGRQVALKLLHPQLLTRGNERARLLREAQALAKLSHPNVVQLYEVGEHDEGLFLAMEYVEGASLSRWRTEEPRRWSEILAIYRQAGQGLAAAHEAGLVHRDFKPANVLVGRDGRPRVVDFGLARSAGLVPDTLLPSGESVSTPSPGETTVTRRGVLVGTPAYMSPEQRRHEPLDASSDQFSYCVALWEALFGGRPEADESGIPQGASAGARAMTIPRNIRQRLARVLRRGLRSVPAQRWSSMGALLEQLDGVRPPHRRSGPLSVLVFGSLGVGWWMSTTSVHPVCSALEAAKPSWSAEHHQEIVAAAARLGIEGHEIVAASVDETLTQWVDQWEGVAEEVCERAREGDPVPGQSECLQGVAQRFTVVGDVLRGQEGALLGAHEALAFLASPRVCKEHPDMVLAEDELGVDEHAMRGLATARIHAAAGNFGEALDVYATLAKGIDEGVPSTLGARIELGRGEVHRERDEMAAARSSHELAVRNAMTVNNRGIAAAALAGLAWAQARELDHDAAQWSAQLCLTQTEDDSARAWRAECLAALAVAKPRPDHAREAIELLTDAIDTEHPIFGARQPSRHRWNRELANAHADLGERDRARTVYEAERAGLAAEFGEGHPTVLLLDFDLALLDLDDAVAAAEEGNESLTAARLQRSADRVTVAIEGLEAAHGPTARLVSPLLLRAKVEMSLASFQEAMRDAERAHELEALLPADHPDRGTALTLAASIAAEAGDLRGALARYEALAEIHGPRPVGDRSLVWHNVAYYRCVVQRCQGARAALERVDPSTSGSAGVDVSLHLDNVRAMVALHEGDPLHARSFAERVLRGLQDSDVSDPHAFEAEARWTLAQVAGKIGDEHEQLAQATGALAAVVDRSGVELTLRTRDPDLFEWARSRGGRDEEGAPRTPSSEGPDGG